MVEDVVRCLINWIESSSKGDCWASFDNCNFSLLEVELFLKDRVKGFMLIYN